MALNWLLKVNLAIKSLIKFTCCWCLSIYFNYKSDGCSLNLKNWLRRQYLSLEILELENQLLFNVFWVMSKKDKEQLVDKFLCNQRQNLNQNMLVWLQALILNRWRRIFLLILVFSRQILFNSLILQGFKIAKEH
mgnify:FL=1